MKKPHTAHLIARAILRAGQRLLQRRTVVFVLLVALYLALMPPMRTQAQENFPDCMGEFAERFQHIMDKWELCRTEIEQWLAGEDANDWLTRYMMTHVYCTIPAQARIAVLIAQFPKCTAFPVGALREPRTHWLA